MTSSKFQIIVFVSLLFCASCKTGGNASTNSGVKTTAVSDKRGKFDASTQQKIDRIFMEAEKAKVIEDWDNAIAKYKELLEIDQNNANAHFQLAQIYTQLSKHTEAEQEAMTASHIEPSNKWYMEMLASVYMNQGKAREATEIFKILIQRFPGNPEYYLNLGFIYSRAGQFENAIKTYDLFEKNFGVDENVIGEKKNLYLRLNKFPEAVKEVHKLVEAFPGEVEYMMMEADLYRANKMKDKATELYQKILEIEPDNARALLAMADINMSNGNAEQGEESIRKIFENPKVDIDIKVKILLPYLQFWELKKSKKDEAFGMAEILTRIHPEEAKAFAVRGDLFYLDNQNDSALAMYLKALSLNKDVFQVWQQVMLIYNTQRDWTNLQKISNEAMELFPNQAHIYLFKGGAEMQLKDYEKALKSLTKGEKISGDDDKLRAQFLANIGDAYHSMNRHAESDSSYERSLKLDPENAYVLNNYSYYLSVRKQNLERAKQMSAYANKLEADNSSFLDTYAWILFQLNDFTAAKEWQEKAIKAGGEKSGTILEHYGDILFKLGQKDQAIDYWKRAKDAGTDSETIEKKIAEGKFLE